MGTQFGIAMFASGILGLLALPAAPAPVFAQVKAPAPTKTLEQHKAPALAAPPRALPGPAEAPGPAKGPRGGVLKLEQLTEQQFKALPDSQSIEIKGQRMTAGELRVKRRQADAEGEAKAKEASAKAQTEFEAYRARFLQEQRAKLDAENAKIDAMAARLKQQSGSPGSIQPPAKLPRQPGAPGQ